MESLKTCPMSYERKNEDYLPEKKIASSSTGELSDRRGTRLVLCLIKAVI